MIGASTNRILGPVLLGLCEVMIKMNLRLSEFSDYAEGLTETEADGLRRRINSLKRT